MNTLNKFLIALAMVMFILNISGQVLIPWFWVFFPIWITPAILFGFLSLILLVGVFCFIGVLIMYALDAIFN